MSGFSIELSKIDLPEVQEEFKRFKRGMSPTHKLMAEWIIQNPGGTYREMGAYFGYSPAWCCTVVTSDMFKAYMAERMKDIQAVVTSDIPKRLGVLAHLAIDRMEEVLQNTGDADTIKDSFDKVMHRYGYAPNAKNGAQGGIQQQNNVFYLNREQFKEVQGQLIQSHSRKLPEPAQEDDRASAELISEKV